MLLYADEMSLGFSAVGAAADIGKRIAKGPSMQYRIKLGLLAVLITVSASASASAPGIVEVTDANFNKEVLKSSVPVLVDFWAVWVAPARAIAPHVEFMATEYQGRLKVGKLDTDANQCVTNVYEIRSMPALLLFKDGKELGRLIGAVPRAKIEGWVKELLRWDEPHDGKRSPRRKRR